ncbi:hypothetical protein Tco_0744414 [Tanacetum coccineum]
MEQQLSNTDASLAKSWSSKNGTATTSDYEEITTCKMEPQHVNHDMIILTFQLATIFGTRRIYSQGVNGQETTETVEKKSTAYLNQHAEVDIRGTLAASRKGKSNGGGLNKRVKEESLSSSAKLLEEVKDQKMHKEQNGQLCIEDDKFLS